MVDRSETHDPIVVEKRRLRREMRDMRRELDRRRQRSDVIVDHLVGLDRVASASRILAYASVPGEVETDGLVTWCDDHGIDVRMPEDDVDATWPDVIVVPGTAFTERGERLGQGGGWYDRFLPGRRCDAFTVGIAFEPQIVGSLPTEPHDVVLDCVVSESGPRFVP